MTDRDGAENAELDPQPATDEVAHTAQEPAEGEATTGPQVEAGLSPDEADEGVSADYQTRLQEFDNVESNTPVVTASAPGEPGAVQMPRAE